MVKPMSNGGPPEISLSGTTSSAPWAGATVATVMPPLLHCPIATPGSPRGNNQCSTAESIQAAHAVAGIQTHHPLIRGNLCLRTATTSRTTKSLQPTYPCRDGDLNPRPSHQRELVHALACTTTATWTTDVYLAHFISHSYQVSYSLVT